MGQQATARRPVAEAMFDAPPRFGYNFERRLTGVAATRWTELCGARTMPLAATYFSDRLAAGSADMGGNSLLLGLSDPASVSIDRVGRVLTRTFGATTGALIDAGPTSLARTLYNAALTARQRLAMVPFEAALSPDGAAPVILLTRGVLLPLTDSAGRLSAAHVVVTWKECLSPGAICALEGELRGVFTDPRRVTTINHAFDDDWLAVRH